MPKPYDMRELCSNIYQLIHAESTITIKHESLKECLQDYSENTKVIMNTIPVKDLNTHVRATHQHDPKICKEFYRGHMSPYDQQKSIDRTFCVCSEVEMDSKLVFTVVSS